MLQFGLTEAQLKIVLEIDRLHHNQYGNIEKVAIEGSWAVGCYKPYSDLDLALFGNISTRQITELREAFAETTSL